MFMLSDGERVAGDKAYQGEPDYYVYAPKNGSGQSAEDMLREGRHEKGNGRFKEWHCLREAWRHDVSRHQRAFIAIAVIEQLEIESGDPIWK
jgi:hypothetical protein